MKATLSVILTVVSGAIGGYAASLFATSVATRPPTESRPSPLIAADTRTVSNTARISCPRVDEFAGPAANAAELSRDAGSPASPGNVRQPLDERQEQRLRLTAHDQEPRDVRWASITQRKLADALSNIPEVTVTGRDGIDCRYATCNVALELRAGADQQATLSQLAEMTDLPCIRHAVLDPPRADNSAPTASLIFDCTEHRTSGDLVGVEK